jgi:hypothetical protein
LPFDAVGEFADPAPPWSCGGWSYGDNWSFGNYHFGGYTFDDTEWGGWNAEPGENPADCLGTTPASPTS